MNEDLHRRLNYIIFVLAFLGVVAIVFSYVRQRSEGACYVSGSCDELPYWMRAAKSNT